MSDVSENINTSPANTSPANTSPACTITLSSNNINNINYNITYKYLYYFIFFMILYIILPLIIRIFKGTLNQNLSRLLLLLLVCYINFIIFTIMFFVDLNKSIEETSELPKEIYNFFTLIYIIILGVILYSANNNKILSNSLNIINLLIIFIYVLYFSIYAYIISKLYNLQTTNITEKNKMFYEILNIYNDFMIFHIPLGFLFLFFSL